MESGLNISLSQLQRTEEEFRLYRYSEISQFFISKYLEQIKKSDLNNPDSSNKQILIITGGVGAGKSTVTYNLIKHLNLEDFLFIGTDTIYYSTFAGEGSFDINRYNDARKFTDEIISQYVANNKSFIWETVFSKEKKFNFLEQCRLNGYKIITIFVGEESPEIQIERSSKRVQNDGYHFVEPEFIKDRYNKTLSAIERLNNCSNTFITFDNSAEKIKLVYYRSNEEQYIADTIPQWFSSIAGNMQGDSEVALK